MRLRFLLFFFMYAGLTGVWGQQVRIYGPLYPANSGTPTTGGFFSIGSDGTGYSEKQFSTDVKTGNSPLGELLVASDGRLYGTTEIGGGFGQGVLYSVKPDGTDYNVVHIFGTVNNDGSNPNGKLVQLSTGEIAGTTLAGGTDGRGTLYSVKPDGSGYKILQSFEDVATGGLPKGGLTRVGNQLFGTVSAGGNGTAGGIFSINADGTGYTLMYKFNTQGGQPQSGLTYSPADGLLYGTTFIDETSSPKQGSIFRIAKDGTGFQVLHLFSAADGKSPQSPLLIGADGALYGTCYGDVSGNIVYTMNVDGSGFKVLHTFASGVNSFGAGLTQTDDGYLYGLYDREMYRMRPDGTGFESLQVFASGAGNIGTWPRTSLTALNGKLYGTLSLGGASARGRVFTYDSEKGFQILFDFGVSFANGIYSSSGLTPIADGKWVALTAWGGAHGNGVMYAVDRSLNLTRLLDMPALPSPDNDYYFGNLVKVSDHTLLGMAASGRGFVYSVQDDGTGFKKILDFTGPNGSSPTALIGGTDGWVYGVTDHGGSNSWGVIYRMKPDGSDFTKLHEFSDNASDGRGFPTGSMIIASNGYLYGCTNASDGSGGRFFRLKTDGTDFSIIAPEATAYQFYYPFREYNGALYNISAGGGGIFRLGLDGSDYGLVYGNSELGDNAQSAIAIDKDGRIYAATTQGGAHQAGTLYSIQHDGTDLKVLRDFDTGFASYELVIVDDSEKASQTVAFDPLPPKIVGDAPFTINAKASSGLPVTFTSDNTSIATVDGNTVTVHASGDAVITATQAGNDVFAPAEARQTLTVRLITGMGEYSGKHLAVRPNPSSGVVYVSTAINTGGKDALVQVLSSTGKSMGVFQAEVADGDLRVDLSALDAGLYILKLAVSGQAVKVIKL